MSDPLAEQARRGYSPALARSIEARNRALRQAAELWSDLPRHQAARLLSVSLTRYAGSGWRHEQHTEASPHPEGSLRDCLWQALRARPRPLSVRQLERVIAASEDHLTKDQV
jgi:hypothetical protein